MACSSSHVPHHCVCRHPISETPAAGAALWSQSPVVAMKLRALFEALGHGAFAVRGADWPEQVEAFVESLSAVERQDLLATEIGCDGKVDPWRAGSVRELLARVRSPWLPRLLNATACGGDSSARLLPHFQPIVRARDGVVVAFEALARAELDGESLSAAPIIHAARAHDALYQFDQLARRVAIRHGWPQLLDGEKLFINFAPAVIYDPSVCLRSTWEAMEEVGCDPTSLVFEVVESEQFPDMDHLRRVLDAYRDLGAQVALDDLGSGHTALRYLDELHPDLIKLDRHLLPTHPAKANLSLLRGLVDYAQGQGITVLAEGVETAEQYQVVRDLGIDMAQGWYFAVPSTRMSRDLAMAGAA